MCIEASLRSRLLYLGLAEKLGSRLAVPAAWIDQAWSSLGSGQGHQGHESPLAGFFSKPYLDDGKAVGSEAFGRPMVVAGLDDGQKKIWFI
jgi:hypothetical protein